MTEKIKLSELESLFREIGSHASLVELTGSVASSSAAIHETMTVSTSLLAWVVRRLHTLNDAVPVLIEIAEASTARRDAILREDWDASTNAWHKMEVALAKVEP